MNELDATEGLTPCCDCATRALTKRNVVIAIDDDWPIKIPGDVLENTYQLDCTRCGQKYLVANTWHLLQAHSYRERHAAQVIEDFLTDLITGGIIPDIKVDDIARSLAKDITTHG